MKRKLIRSGFNWLWVSRPFGRSALGISVLILCGAMFLPGLAGVAYAEAPRKILRPTATIQFALAPAFLPVRDENGLFQSVAPAQLEAELRQHSPGMTFFYAPREKHALIHSEWLEPLLDWYAELLFRFGLYYEREEWDCENYAKMLAALASLQAAHSGFPGLNMPVGWIVVRPVRPWATVPGSNGVLHALNIVRTDRGLVVIEPQNGLRVPLSDYPNRDQILRAFFL